MRFGAIVALILAFPVLEAWVLFELGARFGYWVLAWLAVAAIAGVLLVRLEKLVWALRIVASLSQNRSPLGALVASAKTVIAGGLLIFPGVISDALALILLLWPTPKGRPLDPQAEGVIEGEFRRDDAANRLPPREP